MRIIHDLNLKIATRTVLFVMMLSFVSSFCSFVRFLEFFLLAFLFQTFFDFFPASDLLSEISCDFSIDWIGTRSEAESSSSSGRASLIPNSMIDS